MEMQMIGTELGASQRTHGWARSLLQTLEESPLLLHNTFRKRNFRSNSWQCHILACMFSSLAPRIRSEIADWNFIRGDVHESAPAQIAMEETFQAIKQAESFMESCACEDGGIKALMSTACTGEALIVHIHNLFWCVSSLLLATRVSLGFSEAKLNALIEQQVRCWSMYITRYIGLGAELLDLRQMLSMLAEEETEANILGTTRGEAISEIVKLLTRRLRWVLSRASEVEAMLNDIRIDSKDLERGVPIGSQGYSEASWSGICVTVKKCRLDSFKDRAATLVRLRNPFMLQLIGWSVDAEAPDACYMVMEAAETDLRSFIKEVSEAKSWGSPFPFHVSLDMMLQIARGMWYLHRNHMAHRSLDCSKVLLETSKIPELIGEGYARLKLCDMGLEKEQGTSSSLTEDEVAADVYSFGLLCREILTGRHPNFQEEQVTKQGGLPAPELPSGVPILLSDCLSACCDARSEKRPEFGVICGLLRHLKLIVTSPLRLEQVLNFTPEDDLQSKSNMFNSKTAPTDMDLRLELININVNVLHLSTPKEIYPLVAAEAITQASTSLGLRALEKMSSDLLERIEQGKADGNHNFVVSNAGTLKASLVEGFPGLLRSWSTTTLGMGTLQMWLPHLPADWKVLHTIALGVALCLRYVSQTPPKIGFFSEEGIDGFYPIEPHNILLDCQFKAVLLLDNSPDAWKRLSQWAGVHPQVGTGDNILLSIESYTTYYFGQLLSSIIKARHTNVQNPEPIHSSLDQHLEFVLTNLAMRCIELKHISMTEVVTILLS